MWGLSVDSCVTTCQLQTCPTNYESSAHGHDYPIIYWLPGVHFPLRQRIPRPAEAWQAWPMWQAWMNSTLTSPLLLPPFRKPVPQSALFLRSLMFLAVFVEYLGFPVCIMMLLLLPCFTVNRSTKDTTTPMPSRFIKVALFFGRFQTWFKMFSDVRNLQNTISEVILR